MRSIKAQVTMFIIVGLVLLFVFLFLIQFTNQIQKTSLENQREEVFSQALNKEGLRLYVEDCLIDSLEDGLILLGQQGRLWSDQPGGRKPFLEGVNGVTIYNTNRTVYALTRIENLNASAYPCKDQSQPPAYCQYSYPDSNVKFGEVQFDLASFETDLQRYLINHTVWCVENYTKSEISSAAEIASSDLTLALDLTEAGLSVKVDYPLKFNVKDRNFFHLAEFDFFYETDLRQFLEAVAIYPLQYEQRYLDYDYSAATLSSPEFTYLSKEESSNCLPASDFATSGHYVCRRNSFSDTFNRLQIKSKISILADGDTLFQFSAPNLLQTTDDPYKLQFVRQNRPPALNYVERLACPEAEYDYLVLPRDETLGNLDLQLSAYDPDHDSRNYESAQLNELQLNQPLSFAFADYPLAWNSALNLNPANQLQLDGNNLLPGRYEVKAISTDSYLSDNQTVRVLVDRPLDIAATLRLPYYEESNYVGDDTLGYYLLSREDPVIIDVTFPQSSLTEDQEEITLIYEDGENQYEFPVKQALDPTASETLSITVPQLSGFQSGQFVYSEESLLGMLNPVLFDNPFSQLTNTGKLTLKYDIDYCGRFKQSDSAEVLVNVRACVPYRNPAHPYPYIPGTDFYKYEFPVNADGQTDFSTTPELINGFSPFLADHVCCEDVWTLSTTEKVCFTDPQPDCYSGPSRSSSSLELSGRIVVQKVYTCDNVRGNVCGDGTPEYRLPNNELICGDNDLDGQQSCQENNVCSGQKAWTYVDKDNNGLAEGWCYGAAGCADFCEADVVLTTGATNNYIHDNTRAKENQVMDDDDAKLYLNLKCGCELEDADAGRSCDKNLDGRFNGRCQLVGPREPTPDCVETN